MALTEAGIDTEAQFYNHATRQVWKIVTDASVRGGWELVSPPMRYTADSFTQIETVSHSGTIEVTKIIHWVRITRAMLQAGATSRSVVMRGEPSWPTTARSGSPGHPKRATRPALP